MSNFIIRDFVFEKIMLECIFEQDLRFKYSKLFVGKVTNKKAIRIKVKPFNSIFPNKTLPILLKHAVWQLCRTRWLTYAIYIFALASVNRVIATLVRACISSQNFKDRSLKSRANVILGTKLIYKQTSNNVF